MFIEYRLTRIGLIGAIAVVLTMAARVADAGTDSAWVLADQPNATDTYTPSAVHSFNSKGNTNQIFIGNPGQYGVSLPGMPSRNLQKNPNIQITVYGSNNYCFGFFTSFPATVYCFDPHGSLAYTEFALFYRNDTDWSAGSNHAIAYTLGGGISGGTGTSFNSTGSGVSGTRTGIGVYTATFEGLTKLGGQVDVSTYLPSPGIARCNATGWSASASGTTVGIGCVDQNGNPVDNNYLLAYSYGLPLGNYDVGGRHLGAYTFANQPTRTRPYLAGDRFQYNSFGTGAPVIQRTGTGTYTVTVPGTLTYASSIAIVSAVGPAGTYCNVMSLTGAVTNVGCFAQGGVPTDSKFTLTFQTSPS